MKVFDTPKVLAVFFAIVAFLLGVSSCFMARKLRGLERDLVVARAALPPKTIPATQPSPGVVVPKTTFAEKIEVESPPGISSKASETIRKALESDGRRVVARTEVVAVIEGGEETRETAKDPPTSRPGRRKEAGLSKGGTFDLEWPKGFHLGVLTLNGKAKSGWAVKWGRREYMVSVFISGTAPSPVSVAPGVALILRSKDEKGRVIELPITKAETTYAHRPPDPPKEQWSFDPRPEVSLWGGVGLTLSPTGDLGSGLSGGFGATLGTHLFRYGVKDGRARFKVLGLHAGLFGVSSDVGEGGLRPTFGMVLSPVTVTLPLLRNTSLGAGFGFTVTGSPKTPVTPFFAIGLSFEL